MNESKNSERRKYDRYPTQLTMNYVVRFDVEAKVEYRVKDDKEKGASRAQYSGMLKNVSVEGIGFTTSQELCKKEHLVIELYPPDENKPIFLEGNVKWSRRLSGPQNRSEFEVGIRVTKVNGEPVEKTLFIDKIHNVPWSNLLEVMAGPAKDKFLNKLQNDKAHSPKTSPKNY